MGKTNGWREYDRRLQRLRRQVALNNPDAAPESLEILTVSALQREGLITGPVFRYPGGKWQLAQWVLSFMAPHTHYLIPCGGGASTLLRKQPSEVETYNDLDGGVVNALQQVRDNVDRLLYLLQLTPYSRAEYERAVVALRNPPVDRPAEWARLFFVAHWQAMGGGQSHGWRRTIRAEGRGNKASDDFTGLDRLLAIAARLRGVQFENRDAFELIPELDHAGLQIYLDPPYPHATRKNKRLYLHEWSDADHTRMAGLLRQCRAHVVVSGRPCELYTQLYEDHGWQRIDKEGARGNSGSAATESVWLAPRTYAALVDALALPLFSYGRATGEGAGHGQG